MKFTQTAIPGAMIIDLDLLEDSRGFFARTFCTKEFEAHNLNGSIAQGNLSFCSKKGTLRGMHFQLPPAAENKLVRCLRGEIYDVLFDLRPDSPTFMHATGVHLTAENRRALYIPEMCAHGYQTLTENAEILYLTTAFYQPEKERGIRYNDPRFQIKWPLPVTIISEKDRDWPDFDSAELISP